jgi:ribosomal-protein-alanine N-acetyltransferase
MNDGSILFLPATRADVPRLAAMEVELFRTDRCSRKSLAYLIDHAHVIVARAAATTEIVGYAILLGRKNSRKMRIYSFGIIAAARQRGVAGKMIQALEEIARNNKCTTLTLEVGDDNTAAIAFYCKHGFHQYGFRLGYYEDGGHAILMKKNIPAQAVRP